MEIDDAVPKECLTLPKAHTVAALQIAQRTELTTYPSNMLSRKKRANAGHQAIEAEELLSHHSLYQAATSEELRHNYDQHVQCQEPMRSFHRNNSMAKKKRTLELKKRQGHDNIAASERLSSGCKPLRKTPGSKDKPLLLFVDDRGFGIGSRIKKHQRFGGPWKQNIHGRYTPTIITNEYNSSQTCLFCFHKLAHPSQAIGHSKIKTTSGSFVCLNDKCPNAFKVVYRDQVSAFAIGLAGLASVLFSVTFPCFDPPPPSHQKQNLFNDLALNFLEQKQQQAPPSNGGNTV